MDKSKRRLVKKAKRPLCLTLTYLIALGLIVLLIAVIIPDVINTCVSLAEKLPLLMNDVRTFTEDTLEKFNLSQNFGAEYRDRLDKGCRYDKGLSRKLFRPHFRQRVQHYNLGLLGRL